MENEIMNTTTTKERAEMLNVRINANAKIVAESMAKVGHDLKAMRDEKLYLELGCKTFEEFCDTKTPIGQRQSYNFIRCFEKFGERLAELADIGVTKLALMAALDDEDNEILIESGDAENLSVSQLKERIRELKKKNEQLTLEFDAFGKSNDGSNEDLKAENERLAGELEKVKAASKEQRHLAEKIEIELRSRVNALEKSNEELSARPVDVAVEKPSADEIKKIEKAAAEKAAEKAKKAAEKQHAEEIKKLREELAKKADDERITAVNAARNESAAEIERLKNENSVLQSSAKKAPPTAEKERVKFHIEECMRSFNAALESLNALPEEEREKPKNGLMTIVKKMASALEEDSE